MFKKKEASEVFEEDRNISKKKDNKPRTLFWIVLTTLILLIGLALIGVYLAFTHSYFNIKEISVEGNKTKTDEEIISQINVMKNSNIFKVDAKEVASKLVGIAGIKSAKITKLLPSTIKIELVEDASLGYVKVNNGYLLVGLDQIVKQHVENLSDEEKEEMIKISGAKYKTLALEVNITEDEMQKAFFKELINHELLKHTREVTFDDAGVDTVMRVNSKTIVRFTSLKDIGYKFVLVEKIITDLNNKNQSAKEIIIGDDSNPIVVTD